MLKEEKEEYIYTFVWKKKSSFDSFKTSPMSTEIRQTLCFRGLVLDLINTRVYVLGTNNGRPRG